MRRIEPGLIAFTTSGKETNQTYSVNPEPARRNCSLYGFHIMGSRLYYNQAKLHYAVCVPALTFRLLLSELAILCAGNRIKRLHGLIAATEQVANHHFPPRTTKIKQHRVRLSPEIHKCSSKSRSINKQSVVY